MKHALAMFIINEALLKLLVGWYFTIKFTYILIVYTCMYIYAIFCVTVTGFKEVWN